MRMRRFGALATVNARRNALAMRDSRPLIAGSAAQQPARGAVAGRSGSATYHPRRRERRPRVINVLRHDLPSHAPHANIPTVEREATHSRCPGRARIVAPAVVDRFVAVDAVAAFIDRRSCARATRLNGSMLHLVPICNSVLVNVYSGRGTTRGDRSGGVGKQHAGDGSRH
jgi:hypothetical protein